MITIKLIKSRIRATPQQCKTLDALGLKKIRQERTLPENRAITGMIAVVSHMVEVKKNANS